MEPNRRASDNSSSPGGPQDELSILLGITRAFVSAATLDEAALWMLEWVNKATNGDVAAIRLACPDVGGTLRSVAEEGDGARLQATQGWQGTNAAFTSKAAVARSLDRPFVQRAWPLVSRGESFGVLEVVARAEVLDRSQRLIEAISSQGGIVLRNLSAAEARGTEVAGETTDLVLRLLRATSRTSALKAALELASETLDVPVIAWEKDDAVGLLHATGALGVAGEVEAGLIERLPSLPPWDGLGAGERRQLLIQVSATLGVDGVTVADSDDALLMAPVPDRLTAAFETVGSILQERLRVLRVEASLRDQDERLAQGIASTAHELRSPLVATKMVIERLLQAPEDVELYRDLLRRSGEELGWLATFVEELMLSSAGYDTLDKQPTDIMRVIRQTVESCPIEGAVERVAVWPPDPVMAPADPRYLRTALGNVIRNGLTYSPADGRLHVEVDSRGGRVVIKVRDHGPGIAPAERDAVFDMLSQGSAGKDRGGAGLGLFIARRAMEAQGGTISIQPGGPGTTVVLNLPLD